MPNGRRPTFEEQRAGQTMRGLTHKEMGVPEFDTPVNTFLRAMGLDREQAEKKKKEDYQKELQALQLLPANERMTAFKTSKDPTLRRMGEDIADREQKVMDMIYPTSISDGDVSDSIAHYEKMLTNPMIVNKPKYTAPIKYKIKQLKDDQASTIVTQYIKDNPHLNTEHIRAQLKYDPVGALGLIKKEPNGGLTHSSVVSALRFYQSERANPFSETGQMSDKDYNALINEYRGLEQQFMPWYPKQQRLQKHENAVKKEKPEWFDQNGRVKPEFKQPLKDEVLARMEDKTTFEKITKEEKEQRRKGEELKLRQEKEAEQKAKEAEQKAKEAKRIEQEADDAQVINYASMMGYTGSDVDEAKEIAKYRGVTAKELRDMPGMTGRSETARRQKLVRKHYKTLTTKETTYVKETGMLPERLR